KKFMDIFVPTRAISHDESMIQYFGKHGCKQAIRNKPIPSDIKCGRNVRNQDTS
ncbi:Uncharacterized protein FKW44_012299, partial [Caligus rogercresseyi]